MIWKDLTDNEVIKMESGMQLYFEPMEKNDGYQIRITGRFGEQKIIEDVEEYQNKIAEANEYLEKNYSFNFIDNNKTSKRWHQMIKKAEENHAWYNEKLNKIISTVNGHNWVDDNMNVGLLVE